MFDTFHYSLQVIILLQTVLLATSHSCNLVIYCLSNPAFRKKLYRKLLCRQSTGSSLTSTLAGALLLAPLRVGRRKALQPSDTRLMRTSTEPSLLSNTKRETQNHQTFQKHPSLKAAVPSSPKSVISNGETFETSTGTNTSRTTIPSPKKIPPHRFHTM